ncbi:MAG: hypothetical protein EZS28_004105 [Streblomastix strix]|uniref:Uncharacterized protein n=1 Tax=Streblomastix strix TaxID=222440 RepID=A0A5J4WZL4_9EUKA|nr:MAG: hypothetical protein EZS28_004105 [Streblomastix strix]
MKKKKIIKEIMLMEIQEKNEIKWIAIIMVIIREVLVCEMHDDVCDDDDVNTIILLEIIIVVLEIIIVVLEIIIVDYFDHTIEMEKEEVKQDEKIRQLNNAYLVNVSENQKENDWDYLIDSEIQEQNNVIIIMSKMERLVMVNELEILEEVSALGILQVLISIGMIMNEEGINVLEIVILNVVIEEYYEGDQSKDLDLEEENEQEFDFQDNAEYEQDEQEEYDIYEAGESGDYYNYQGECYQEGQGEGDKESETDVRDDSAIDDEL